jgi:homocysteine S-methyltransferase
VGPYGAFLTDGSEYRGDYGLSAAELRSFHRERLDLLLDAEPDLLALETLPCKVEAQALLDLLRERPGARAWLSFSCRDAGHVSHGETFAECVALAEGHEAIVAAGVNCTAPAFVGELLRGAAARCSVPLLAYPNSGERWDAERRAWDGDGAAAAELPVESWLDAGAKLVGGCCRTTPQDIASLRRRVLARGGARR